MHVEQYGMSVGDQFLIGMSVVIQIVSELDCGTLVHVVVGMWGGGVCSVSTSMAGDALCVLLEGGRRVICAGW